jgi:hypothetical protein
MPGAIVEATGRERLGVEVEVEVVISLDVKVMPLLLPAVSTVRYSSVVLFFDVSPDAERSVSLLLPGIAVVLEDFFKVAPLPLS